MRALADTSVLVGWFNDEPSLTRPHVRAMRRVSPDSPILVSSISFWEIGMLYERGRIRLPRPLRDWLEEIVGSERIRIQSISPAVVVEMTSLTSTVGWDPADRIIVATARVEGASVLTTDTRIIESGLVPTV